MVVIFMTKHMCAEWITNIVNGIISDDAPENAVKPGTNAFTRDRKLPFGRMLLMILRGIKSQLVVASKKLFDDLSLTLCPSRQAVSNARTNLQPEYIHQLVNDHAEVACSCEDSELFAERFRLCAIDGSGVSVNNALSDVYGTQNGAATALASLAYDPLNDIILDGTLHPGATDERDAAETNIEAVERVTGGRETIFIEDRGYNSREHVSWLIRGERNFVIRARKKYDLTFDNALGRGEWRLFEYEGRSYAVRVLKVTLDDGEIETLITNVNKCYLPWSQAKELYFERWRIEEKFKELKEKLALEAMRGKREVTVLQDYYATLWLSNFAAMIRWNTDALIDERTDGKNLKYKRKTDVNWLLTNLRGMFFRCITEKTEAKRKQLLDSLYAEVARFDVEVKPGRHVPRVKKARIRRCNARNCAGVG